MRRLGWAALVESITSTFIGDAFVEEDEAKPEAAQIPADSLPAK